MTLKRPREDTPIADIVRAFGAFAINPSNVLRDEVKICSEAVEKTPILSQRCRVVETLTIMDDSFSDTIKTVVSELLWPY
jgi:hypothetical protein